MRQIHLTLVLIFYSSFCQSQIEFSKYIAMTNRVPQLMNPALVGIRSNDEFNIMMWNPGYRLNHNEYIDYNGHSNKIHGGFGFYFQHEQMMVQYTNTLGVTYAYKQSLNRKLCMSIGVSGLYVKQNNLFGQSIGSTKQEVLSTFDMSSGIVLYTEKLYLSNRFGRLLRGDKIHYLGSIGYVLTPGQNLKVNMTPILEYQKHDDFVEITAKLNFRFKMLYLSGAISNHFLTPSLGININKFSLGVSVNFQRSISELSGHTSFIEYSLRIQTRHNRRHRDIIRSFDYFLF